MKPWKKTIAFQLKKLTGRALFIRQLEIIRKDKLSIFYFKKGSIQNIEQLNRKYPHTLEKGCTNELLKFGKDEMIPIEWIRSDSFYQQYESFLKYRPDLSQRGFPSSFYHLYKAITKLLDSTKSIVDFLEVCCNIESDNPKIWLNYKKLIQQNRWMQEFDFVPLKGLSGLQQDQLQEVLENPPVPALKKNFLHRVIGCLSQPYSQIHFRDNFNHFYNHILPEFISVFDKQISVPYALFIAWFKFWIRHQNPTLQGDMINANYAQLSTIPLQQILKYVPNFLIGNMQFFTHSDVQLFIHLAMGKSLRELTAFQLFSKKHLHHFLTLTVGLIPFDRKFIYSYLYALGFTNLAVIRVLAGYIPSPTSYIKELRNKNRLDISYEEIVPFTLGYLENQKLFFLKIKQWFDLDGSTEILTRIAAYEQHCRDEELPFRIKKRSLSSLLREVEQWEAEQGNHFSYNNYVVYDTWIGAAYSEQSFTLEDRNYFITQITTKKDIAKEGSAMHHCVGGYAGMCGAGRCSIWSLRLAKPNGQMISKVTIEVDSHHRIVQAKGPYNAQPAKKFLDIIYSWAECNGIKKG